MSRSARKSKRPDPTVAPVIRNPLKDDRLEIRAWFTPSALKEETRMYASAARAINHFGIRFHGVGARFLRRIPLSGGAKPAGAKNLVLYGALDAAAKRDAQ